MKNQMKMPALFVLAILMFHINSTYAQSGNPPYSVTNSFSLKYPQAKVMRWKKQVDGYTVKFAQDKQVYHATFSAKGSWITTTSKITWPWGLPAKVRARLKQSKYAAWRIDQSQSAETPSLRYYKVWVDNASVTIDALHQNEIVDNRLLTLTADGKLISNEPYKATSF
jgi:hypothetical protein